MSASVTDPRLAFHATYFDTASHTVKEFLCVFYYGDATIELIDAKAGKTFLKRTKCPNLTKAHFFLGANIVVFGRVLTLVRYGDKVTEQLSERVSESVIAVIGSEVFARLGECLDIITIECGFGICDMQMIELRSADWDAPGAGVTPPAAALPRAFSGRRALVLNLIRDQAISKAQDLPNRCSAQASVWVAATKAEVESAQQLVTLAHRRPAADLSGPSSVVIVKPHVVSARRGGEVLQALLEMCPGVALSALSQVTLSAAHVDALLQPYKGVLEEYRGTVEQIASGACWALQFVPRRDDVDPVGAVREAVGPFDPTIAKVLRPKSLRARLGKDVARNGLHCSDLPDDGIEDANFLWGAGR